MEKRLRRLLELVQCQCSCWQFVSLCFCFLVTQAALLDLQQAYDRSLDKAKKEISKVVHGSPTATSYKHDGCDVAVCQAVLSSVRCGVHVQRASKWDLYVLIHRLCPAHFLLWHRALPCQCVRQPVQPQAVVRLQLEVASCCTERVDGCLAQFLFVPHPPHP